MSLGRHPPRRPQGLDPGRSPRYTRSPRRRQCPKHKLRFNLRHPHVSGLSWRAVLTYVCRRRRSIRKEIARSWAFVRTEARGRPISEAIWAGGHFCAMFISFATSSYVQRCRCWVMCIAPPEQMSLKPSKSRFIEKVPALDRLRTPMDTLGLTDPISRRGVISSKAVGGSFRRERTCPFLESPFHSRDVP